jgi:hypothetical protein
VTTLSVVSAAAGNATIESDAANDAATQKANLRMDASSGKTF